MKIDKTKKKELNLYGNTQYTNEDILSLYEKVKKIDDEIKILQDKKIEVLKKFGLAKGTFYYRLRKLGKTIRKQV